MSQKLSHLQYADWLEKSLLAWLPSQFSDLREKLQEQGLSDGNLQEILKTFDQSTKLQLIETPNLISLRGVVLNHVAISFNFNLEHYQSHELCTPTITALCLEEELSQVEMASVIGAAELLMWKVFHTDEFSQMMIQMEKILLKGELEGTGTKLQKIIFTIKVDQNILENSSVDGLESHQNILIKEENNPGLFESQPVNSFFNAKNVPSPVNIPPTMGLHKKIQQSFYDLIYVFSDGTQLNLNKIHFHPHARILHKDLLPSKIILSHLDPYIKTYERTEVNRNKYSAAISILWNALKTRQQHRINTYFALETIHQFYIFPLNHISFAQAGHNTLPQERQIGSQKKVHATHWELNLKMLRAQKKSSTVSFSQNIFKDKISFLNGLYDQNSLQLYFHPFSSFIYRYLKTQEDSPQMPLLKPKWFEIDLTQFDSVSPVINNLQHLCENNHVNFRVSQDSITISHDKVKPHYFFDDNRCVVSLKIQLSDETLWLSNLTGFQHSLVEILANGFKSFPCMKESKIRTRRKDIIRDMDLRVFKHRGLSFIFVTELIQWLLDNEDSLYNNEQINESMARQILEPIFKKMAHIIFSYSNTPSMPRKNSIKSVCSHLLIQNFTDGTIELIKQALAPVNFLYKKNLYQIPKAHLLHLQFIKNWLKSVCDSTREQCLTRQNKSFTPVIEEFPKFSIASNTQEAHSYPLLRDDELNKWTLSPWKYYSSEDNVVCYYKGLEVYFITDKNFSGHLHLVEREGHDNIDWFALDPEFFLNKGKVSPDQIYHLLEESALDHQGKFYILNDTNDVPTLKALQWFWKRMPRKDLDDSSYFMLPRHQILDLLALRATGIPITGNKRWKQICEFYDNLDKPRQPLNLPDSFRANLKPYQDNGLNWILDLYNLGLGGILADDMGLGKTVQALSFFEFLRSKNKLGYNLVIVPTSLTYNWVSESEKFTPELPIIRFSSKEKGKLTDFLKINNHCVIITTYGLLTENQDFFSQFQWNSHVYDEAQNLKNITAKRTCAARQISAKFKLCLTGTPMENHYGELYSLMDLVVPGSLGDLSEFKKMFVSSNSVQPSNIHHLKLQIKPLILRRTKSQILKDLPPKTEIILKIPFCEKQKMIYKNLAMSWQAKVKDSISNVGEAKTQIIMLTALLRLRQACSDPASIPNVTYPDLPPKISTLTDSIDDIIQNNDSAIIFTQFLTTLRRLEKEITLKGIPVFVLHGSLNQKKREEALKGFDNCKTGAVFIMTLKTGGTGLNLTKASYVFHLEPWWNPAVENQATDRTHRIGQTKPITVYRYLMKESIEEKVEVLKERKASKFAALFKETEDQSAPTTEGSHRISREDFDYLLDTLP